MIKDAEGNVVATTVTDDQGNYSVTGLIPAEYTVEFFDTDGELAAVQSTSGRLAAGETMSLPLPLDVSFAQNADIDDNAVLLSKSVNKQQISVGEQLYYTIRAENTIEDALTIDVRDDLPTGFKLTADTVKLTRAGADGNFGTADDVVSTLNRIGTDPVRFGPIELAVEEKVQIGYLVKVGTAAVQGNATNIAQTLGAGSETDIASNVATASVQVVADKALDQSALIGKVFNDRDGDGYQDPANVTGITVKSDYFGWNSLHLGGLNARGSDSDNLAKHRKVIRMPWGSNNAFKVTTQQGTVINVDQYGNLSEAHTGLKAQGLTAQDIRLTTKRTRGIPTQTPVEAMRTSGNVMDVLEISITNFGITEEGLPGIRLATAKGLVIETDAYGRYHLPDVDGGRRSLGKNFIIKVDEASLPEGASVTTENPRVIRATGSALNKINFGVRFGSEQTSQGASSVQPSKATAAYQSVDVNLGNGFFDKGHHHIRKDHYSVMDDIAAKIKQYGHAHITIDAQGNTMLEKRRLHSVKAQLLKRLGQQLMQNVRIDVATQ